MERKNSSEALDNILDDALVSKEEKWKKERCGKITSSVCPKIMKGTKTKYFSDTAITELFKIKYERRTGKVREPVYCKNFEFGKENEPLALKRYALDNPHLRVKSCNTDFSKIIFMKPFKNFGDSPDAYIYKGRRRDMVAEVKCNVSEGKYEEMCDISEITETHEYYWQFIAHLAGSPKVRGLVWINYNPFNDEGHYVEMLREDYIDDIILLKFKVTQANIYIDLCLKYPKKYKLRDINKWVKENYE